MAESNPYPPGDDYWVRDIERRLDRVEQWRESINFGRLEDKVTHVQSDVIDVKRELREHIAEVKPLLASDASRTGVSGLVRWALPLLIALMIAVPNFIALALR